MVCAVRELFEGIDIDSHNTMKPIFIADCNVHLLQFCVSSVALILHFITSDFLFVAQIFREWLNRYAPNSQGRCVWSLAWTSLNIKVKRQSHQGQKMRCPVPLPPAVTEWNALAANDIMQMQMAPFRRCREGGVISASLHAAYV